MRIIDLNDAKKRLSELLEQAANGQPFIIAKAGKPMVKVVALEARKSSQIKRIGFMKGQISVPDNFDRMKSIEIRNLFEGAP
jgi:prevent-host-death family protein